MRSIEIIEYAERNDCDGINRCLSEGYPIDETRPDGMSALLVACSCGSMDSLKLLVERNANIYIKDNRGMNAVSQAACNNNVDIVEYLLQCGIDPNDVDTMSQNTLHIACKSGSNETIHYLLHNHCITDINAKTNNGKDALLLAIEGGCSASCVMELLVNGANVNTQTADGRTVLMECIISNHPQLFHLLYRYSNINVNRIDHKKNSCMHFACSVGNTAIIKALLHRGAFARVQNSSGKFPIDLAREKRNEECMELMEQVTSPPSTPTIKSLRLDNRDDSVVIVTWEVPSQPNYYPLITAVEIQLKLQKLFESWKTVDTITKGDSVFKEPVAKSNQSYAEGEATDVDEEEDQMDRSQVEVICASFSEQYGLLEHRIEPNREETKLRNFYRLKKLNFKVTYSIRVRCANKYGWSDYSQGIVFCPKDIIDSWNAADSVPKVTPRSSSMLFTPSVETHQVNWEKVDNNALTLQRRDSRPEATSVIDQIINGGVEVLRAKISEGVDLKTLRKKNGMSILHVAAASPTENARAIVEEVISGGYLDVNDVNGGCTTALHYAVYNNNGPVVLYLLQHRADVTVTDSSGMTPFLLAADRGYLQVCTLMMDHITREQTQVVDKYGRNALALAVCSSHLDVAEFLMKKGFSSQYKTPPPHGWNLLFLAISTKNEDVIKFCLEQGISPLETCSDGIDAVEYSQEKGLTSITSLLERYSSTPAPIESASVQASKTQADITVVIPNLIERHPLFITSRIEVNYRKTALLQSAQSLVIDVDASQSSVRVQLVNLAPGTTYRFKVRQANKNGWSDWKGGFEFTTTRQDVLVRQQASMNCLSLVSGEMNRVDYENREHPGDRDEAVKKAIDDVSLTDLLQISPNRVSKAMCACGLPAMHYAVLRSEGMESEMESLIDVLLGMCCSLEQAVTAMGFTDLTPLHCACMLSTPDMLEYLINSGGNVLQGEIGDVPACAVYALLAPTTAVLKFLLERQIITPQQSTALMLILARSRGSRTAEFAELLMQYGSDLNVLDSRGDCLLHIAVAHNNVSFLQYMMTHGMKRDVRNASGLTVFEYAERLNQTSVMDFLINGLRAPLPVINIHQRTLDSMHCLFTWECPTSVEGIPASDQYAVEIVDSLTNQCLVLPDTIRTTCYVFLEVPLPMHRWLWIRVRAHNVNGWGEWVESRLCSQETMKDTVFMQDGFFVWLLCHNLGDAYDVLKMRAIDSPEKLAALTTEAIDTWPVLSDVRHKIVNVLPSIVDEVLQGETNPMVKSGCSFKWYQ